MTHFAQIEDNLVVNVIVVNSIDILDSENNESELVGSNFCTNLLGGTWVQTSYNTHGGVHSKGNIPLRKNYAGKGYTYDKTRDAFIPPPPYPSWRLDEDTCNWVSPVAKPTDGLRYEWDESTLTWKTE